MTKRNRIEVVEDGDAVPGGGPDLGRFKVPPDDQDAKDAERREKERLRARERRARAKGKSTTSADPVEVDIATCHYVNAFLLNIAGVVTRRKIEATDEQHATLDASLQQIAAKYGASVLKYAPEIAFATTFVVVVRSSPPVSSTVAVEVTPDAEAGQQDRPDLGAQG